MNRTLLSLLCATALAAGGCRDLDYPEGEDAENAPPDVSILLPLEGDVVSTSPVVSIDARDANGVSSVTLFCGGVPVYVWTAPPYTANVELGGCGGTASADGRRTLSLSVVARDVPGMESAPVPRAVVIDASVAQLQLSGSGRAAPHGSYLARITADRTLGALPVARIGSTAGTVVERTDLQTQPLTVFDVTFSALPGLRAEAWDGGAPPLEVLEDLEETLLLEVEGRATSGNVTRAVERVVVSQLAWRVPSPLTYIAWGSGTADTRIPAARSEGLVILFDANTGLGRIPGTLAHQDGRLLPFPTAEAQRLAGEAFSLDRLDAQGRAYFMRADGGSYEYAVHDPVTGAALGGGTIADPLAETRRIGDEICYEQVVNGGACDLTGTRSLVCQSPAGTTQSATISDESLAYSTSLHWTVSDGLYLGYANYSICSGDETAVFAAERGGSARIAQLSPGASPPGAILPLSGGRFLVSQFSAAQGYRAYVLDRTLAEQGEFFSAEALTYLGLDPGTGAPPPEMFLASRPSDDTVLLIRHLPLQTLIEAWRAQAATPLATVRLPGELVPNTQYGDKAALLNADGSLFLALTMLSLSSGGEPVQIPGRSVLLSLSPDLQLRWLYRAPGTAPGAIYAHPSEGHLYFVDEVAQQVTAFHR